MREIINRADCSTSILSASVHIKLGLFLRKISGRQRFDAWNMVGSGPDNAVFQFVEQVTLKRSLPTTNIVVVQLITARWSKAARGGPAAGARNRVPESLGLPPIERAARWSGVHMPRLSLTPTPSEEAGMTPLYFHWAFFGEGNDFAAPREYWIRFISRLPEPSMLETYYYPAAPLHFELENGRLNATLHWENVAGQPRRYAKRPTAHVSVELGEWARICYNLRRSEEDGWEYWKVVQNVGYTDKFDPSFFTRTAPVKTVSDIAILF